MSSKLTQQFIRKHQETSDSKSNYEPINRVDSNYFKYSLLAHISLSVRMCARTAFIAVTFGSIFVASAFSKRVALGTRMLLKGKQGAKKCAKHTLLGQPSVVRHE